MGKMAIVKASFTKERSEAKAFIRYIQHRNGKDGHKATGNCMELMASCSGWRHMS
jgi:hypothetical protein